MTLQDFLKVEDKVAEAVKCAMLTAIESMGERAYKIEWFNSHGDSVAKN